MWQSCLLINVGDNPDHPRPGRLWLRNLYHVHQRLCMAFPSALRKSDDTEFLKPFKPDDFGNGEVHVRTKADSGFLFRVDPGAHGRAVILVQSAAKPDWEYAFQNARFLLAAPPEVKPFDPLFEVGQRLRFRLLANPTRRLSKNSPGSDGKPMMREWSNKDGKGKRVPVHEDKLHDWLARQSERAGFYAEQKQVAIQPGYIYMNKAKTGQRTRLRSVRYDGILTVNDVAQFREAIAGGLGPGKAFGFGLLSVAPYLESGNDHGMTPVQE